MFDSEFCVKLFLLWNVSSDCEQCRVLILLSCNYYGVLELKRKQYVDSEFA